MANNVIKYLVINAKETLGDKLLMLESRKYDKYVEGIKTE